MSAFRMFKRPGPPGHYYGYITIEGKEYRLTAQSVGAKGKKHFEGSITRNLKADQTKLPLTGGQAKPKKAEKHTLSRDSSDGLIVQSVNTVEFDDDPIEALDDKPF